MTEIKYVTAEDKSFWYTLDKHLQEDQFEIKVRDKMGYVLFEDENLLEFYATIYSGIIPLFAQCCLWIGRHRKKVTAEN